MGSKNHLNIAVFFWISLTVKKLTKFGLLEKFCQNITFVYILGHCRHWYYKKKNLLFFRTDCAHPIRHTCKEKYGTFIEKDTTVWRWRESVVGKISKVFAKLGFKFQQAEVAEIHSPTIQHADFLKRSLEDTIYST